MEPHGGVAEPVGVRSAARAAMASSAMVGMNRVPPQVNIFSDSAVDTITSALQFASTNTLIELFGGVAFLIGAMALIGALTAAAVKASR